MSGSELQRLQYNHPNLEVDLGVGLWAWPMPMDFDKDGDFDLVVVCPDKPFNGTYFFENKQGNVKMPVFEPPVRIGKGTHNVQVSYVDGEPRVLSPGIEHTEFYEKGIDTGVELPVKAGEIFQSVGSTRARQWKYVDFDGDGLPDLVAGFGDWTDYGWDDAYNDLGVWTNGPLRGYVFWLKNQGSHEKPEYRKLQQLMAGDEPLTMDRQMIVPVAFDWDGDGRLDILFNSENADFYRNMGERDGKTILQNMGNLDTRKVSGHTSSPTVVDWDNNGVPDLLVGAEDGRLYYKKNPRG